MNASIGWPLHRGFPTPGTGCRAGFLKSPPLAIFLGDLGFGYARLPSSHCRAWGRVRFGLGTIPLRALIDPFTKYVDLFVAEAAAHRHDRRLHSRYAKIQRALLGVTRNERGTVNAALEHSGPRAEVEIGHLLPLTMALETLLLENG